MSGHSKWAQTKHKKAVIDARRGKIFSKLIKEITVAARLGGGDPEANPRLRAAIENAKAYNMPAENIRRAIQRGTGEIPGTHYEEVVYEGYGPGGVAVMVEVTTDNKNRSASEIRSIFSRHGANLGEAGCVSWMFQKKGLISVDKDKASEDELMAIALEAGAEDFRVEEDACIIYTLSRDFENVKKVLQDRRVPLGYADITMVPQTTVKLEGEEARKMLRLMETLEDHDDVQNIYANFDISAKIMEEFQV